MISNSGKSNSGTSSWYSGVRPFTLAILAMGGEGGGVLADWIVAVAENADYSAQTTSVAGVAQRTGATVYYVELFPPTLVPRASGVRPRQEPVLAVFPTSGEVDVVIASELMEAGRAVQRGFCTPDRTTLIASINRVYSIEEKMALGDGRVHSAALLSAAKRASARLIAADFMAIAEQANSVISAALFGALAGSGALPFSREQFEAPIREFGKAVDQSLTAFAGGLDAARGSGSDGGAEGGTLATNDRARSAGPVDITIGRRPVSVEERKQRDEARRNAIAATDPGKLVGPALRPLAEKIGTLPAAARSMILHGMVRTATYQDVNYARCFVHRVRQFAAVDPDAAGAAALTTEAARHIALWMCYQDTIQVALQKTRRRRMERIRLEARAGADQLIQVREYLHPQIDEITDTLPAWLGARLRRSTWFQWVVNAITGRGMRVNTSSITGYTALALVARLRPLRPRSLRFHREHQAIDRWTRTALAVAVDDANLAREIIECQRVLKGYGTTYQHGTDSFAKLMLAADMITGRPGAAHQLAQLRAAALADEAGTALDIELDRILDTDPSSR